MRRRADAPGGARSIAKLPFALRTLSRLLNALASPAQMADPDLLERLMRRCYAVTRMPSVAPDLVCRCGRRHRPYARCDLGLRIRADASWAVMQDTGALLRILAREVLNPDARILVYDPAATGESLAIYWFGGIKRRTARQRLQALLPDTRLPALAREPASPEWRRVERQVQALFQFEHTGDLWTLCSSGVLLPDTGEPWRTLPFRGRLVGDVIADLWESGGGLPRPTDDELAVWLGCPHASIRKAAFVALGQPLDAIIWPKRRRRGPVRSTDGVPVDV